MYKRSSGAQAHIQRTASHSTRASATGRNLLGWDNIPEQMTPRERYEALKLHLERLNQINEALKKNPRACQETIKENKLRIGMAMEQMRLLKPHAKANRTYDDNFRDYIVQAIKERVSPAQWVELTKVAHDWMSAVQQASESVLAPTYASPSASSRPILSVLRKSTV